VVGLLTNFLVTISSHHCRHTVFTTLVYAIANTYKFANLRILVQFTELKRETFMWKGSKNLNLLNSFKFVSCIHIQVVNIVIKIN
jgi:hypothetical protein